MPRPGSSPWATLPSDVFEKVLNSQRDSPDRCGAPSPVCTFRLVCREWRALADSAVTELAPSYDEYAGVQDMPVAQLFPHLIRLDLSRCAGGVDTILLTSLATLGGLDSLVLAGCEEVGDAGVAALAGLPRLRSLSLSGCRRVTDVALLALTLPASHVASSPPLLTSLDISSCSSITSAGVELFVRRGGGMLNSLSLEDLPTVSDSAIAAVSALPQLAVLNLAGVSTVTDTGVSHLTALCGLTSLDLGGCSQLGHAGIRQIGCLSRLRHLDLSVTGVTDSTLSELLPRLRDLHTLRLAACEGLTGYSICRLGQALPHLEELSLNCNVGVTDRSLEGLSALKGLRSLDLGYCVTVTDEGLSFLATMQTLEHLSLAGCLWVHLSAPSSPDPLQPPNNPCSPGKPADLRAWIAPHPITHAKSLQSLNLSGSGVRDDGLRQLATLPKLTELDTSDCHEITSIGIATMMLCASRQIALDTKCCHQVDRQRVDNLLLAAAHMPELFPHATMAAA
mmetsp:Transcript_17044/g.44234  ORF Transcript_17044/g.44234 Transcript_17044/m.44234 type:complete len:508 (-) Transcript_17044:224-1747(-)|eukprot:jgi/Tetstr1/425069/TSEL_015533.t1